jgi:hypothetical protein
MKLLLFLVFSTIEFASAYILSLAIFLFPIRSNLTRIVFASLFLAQASFLIREELGLTTFAPFFQAIIIFLFIWLLFRVQPFYAAIMTVFGNIFFTLLQFVLFIAYSKVFHLFTLEESTTNPIWNYFMQSSSSVLTLVICWFLIKKRIGFTFVPDNHKSIKFHGNNVYFLFAVFLALLLFSTIYLFGDDPIRFLILGLLFISTLVLLVLLAFRKEGDHD